MQETLPFKPWTPPIPQPQPQPSNYRQSPAAPQIPSNKPKGNVRELVSENAVIVFGRRGCCMSHVVKRLLHGLGVNPAVYEVEEEDEAGVIRELETVVVGGGGGGGDRQLVQFPAVFIGGRLFGGLDRVMATHITGELTPLLKQAGALWL